MKFYVLKHSTNLKEIGTYPQVGVPIAVEDDVITGEPRLVDLYDLKAPDSVYNLRSDCFPDFKPNFNLATDPNAKLTDLMSQGPIAGIGLLISDKLKKIFEESNLIPHRFYPVILNHKGMKYYNYYWMHTVYNIQLFIDFEKTDFYLSTYISKIKDLDINSEYEFLKIENEIREQKLNRTIETKRLYLNKEFNQDVDLIVESSLIDGFFHISERLRERLINEKITGIDVENESTIIIE